MRDDALKVQDLLRCLPVCRLRLRVAQEMRQIRTDDDQRLLAAPQGLKNLGETRDKKDTYRNGEKRGSE